MPSVRVGVVVVQDGRLLLIHHRRRGLSYWVVPGGKVQEFEAVAACAAREIREETGLEINIGLLIAVFEINDRWRQHELNLLFIAGCERGSLGAPSCGPLSETLDHAEFVEGARLATIDLRPPKLRPLLEVLLTGARPGAQYLGDLTAESTEGEPQ